MRKVKFRLLITLITAAIFAAAFGVSLTTNAAERDNSVEIGYSFDFSSYEGDGSALKWKDDVYATENLKTAIPGGEIKGLSVWGTDNSVYEGYVTYKIVADKAVSDKVIHTLSLLFNGRIDDWGGNFGCGVSVYAGVTADGLELVKSVSAVQKGVTGYSFDIADEDSPLSGEKQLFVKIVMRGAKTWVSAQRLSFSGEVRYDGYPDEKPQITDGETLFDMPAEGEKFPLRNVSLSGGATDVKITASVIFPDGSSQPAEEDGGKFGITPKGLGRYVVEYKIIADGKREYSYSYEFYCVDDTTKDGTVVKNGNYATDLISSADNYDISDIAGFSEKYDGFKLENSSANYLLPVVADGKTSIVFDVKNLKADGFAEISVSDESYFGDKGAAAEIIAVNEGYKLNIINLFGGERKIVKTIELPGEYEPKIAFKTGNGTAEVLCGGETITVTDTGCDFVDGVYLGYKAENASLRVTVDRRFNDEEFKNTDNYYSFDVSTVNGADDGIIVDGEASYLLPLDFTSALQTVFDAGIFDDEKTFEIAFVSSAGKVDFDARDKKGLYFTIKKMSGVLCMSGYFVGAAENGGNVVYSLGEVEVKNTGVHGLSLVRRVAAPQTGIEIWIDKEQYSSYDSCYTVNVEDFVADGKVFVSYRATGGKTKIRSVVKSDAYSPAMYSADGDYYTIGKKSKDGLFAGDDYEIENVIFYDDIDGIIENYTVSATDSYGKEVEIIEDGNIRKFPLVYSGEYTITFTARDYTGNTLVDYIYLAVELKDGAPVMIFYDEPAETGRTAVPYYIPAPEYDDGEGVTTKVKITDPKGDGLSFDLGENGMNFVPYETGVYGILYCATKNGLTTYSYYETDVKINADESKSYRDVNKPESWYAGETRTEKNANGITVKDTSYCYLPFETYNGGLEITLDVSGLGNKKSGASDYRDCWVSLGIGSSPALGGFASPVAGTLYFMIYRENSEWLTYATVQTARNVTQPLFGPESLGNTGIFTLSLERVTDSDTRTDNINIYIDHKKVGYSTILDYVRYSEISDNENFSYISVYSYGACEAEYRSATIKSVSVSDQLAPEIILSSEMPSRLTLGRKVRLPRITFKDNSDKNIKTFAMLVSPSGVKTEVGNNFTPSETGTYVYVLRARDKSGNETFKEYKIIVEEEKRGLPTAAIVAIVLGAAAIVGAGAFLSVKFILKKKKGDKK